MKKQDELRGQIATMKVAASALIDSGKVAEAKEEIAKMKSIQEQITLLDQLDNDFAAQASAAEGTGITAAAASGKPAGNDAVKAFAAAARMGFKAMNKESTDEDGLYIVPEDISTRIEKYKEAKFSLRQLVTSISVRTLKGARTFKTKATQTGLTEVAEGGSIGEGETPTFERVPYTIKKYGGIFPVTSEVIADTDANLTGTLVEWIGDEEIVTENKLITTLIATKSPVPIAGLDDIKKIINVTLGSAYADGVQIVTNDDGLQYLDTLKDGDNRYLLSPDPRIPMQMRLSVGARSVPIVVIPNTVLATTEQKIPFIIGDLKEGIILWDRHQLSIKMSDTAVVGSLNAFSNDLTLYRALARLCVTFRDKDAVAYGQVTAAGE